MDEVIDEVVSGEGEDFEIVVAMEQVDCPTCGISICIPKSFINARRKDQQYFYCPNNHSMFFKAEVNAENKNG